MKSPVQSQIKFCLALNSNRLRSAVICDIVKYVNRIRETADPTSYLSTLNKRKMSKSEESWEE